AHRQVGGLGRLEAVDDVEDDLAVVHLDREVVQAAVAVVAAPDLELRLVRHGCFVSVVAVADAGRSASSSSVRYFFSSALSSGASGSGRIFGSGWCLICAWPSGPTRQTRLTLRHCGSIAG